MPLNTDSYRDNSNPSPISNNSDIVKGLRPQKLNCAALNVCGLRRRILYTDFVNLINQYHIFSVCETKLDNFDIIDMFDFEFISQMRKQKGSLTLAMGKCLWFPVKIKVCQSSLSSH